MSSSEPTNPPVNPDVDPSAPSPPPTPDPVPDPGGVPPDAPVIRVNCYRCREELYASDVTTAGGAEAVYTAAGCYDEPPTCPGALSGALAASQPPDELPDEPAP